MWVDDAQPRPFADRSDPAVSGASIEALVVLSAKDRALASLTDCEIDGSCRAGHERNHRWPVSLTEDAKRAVTAFEAEVFDVGCARLGHAQSVEAKQHGERGMVAVEVLGGKQEPAEITAVHSVSFGGLHLGAAHVLGGIGGDPAAMWAKRKYPHTVDRRGSIVDGARPHCSIVERYISM